MLAERKVLVLNKSWRAIAIITLEKALSKVFSTYDDGTPKAKIIDPSNDFMMFEWHEWSQIMPNDNELKIRTVSASYRVPEVIQYTKYDKVPCTKAQFNRRSIYRRDNSTCQYCGEKKKSDELSLDHIIPRCQGGKTNWENIVGAEIAEHTEPIAILEGVLTIRTSSTAWATQLNLISNDVLASLQASAPGALVEKLSIIGPQGPTWKRGLRTIRGARGPRDTFG